MLEIDTFYGKNISVFVRWKLFVFYIKYLRNLVYLSKFGVQKIDHS